MDVFQIIKKTEWWLARNLTLLNRPNGKFIRRQEKRLVKKLKGIFTKQENYIVEKLKNLSAFKNTIEDEIDAMINNMPGQPALADAIIAQMKVAMLKGGKYSIKELRLAAYGITFTLKNKKAIEFLEAKKRLELSNFRGNITGTTKAKIREILINAANTGQSYQKTAQLIRAQGGAGVFSQARGELIATREIGIAYEVGNNIPFREFLDKNPDRKGEKHWQTVEDDKVTPECRENQEAEWIPEKKRFPSGDETAPRDGNPRCRCFTKYRIL